MKQEDLKSLPSCSMSAHCLRLVDDLDQPRTSQWLSLADDSADERLVEQLREHVQTCPTCTAMLAQARRIRAQQRALLRNVLLDSEQKVPTTTSHIFAALRQEQRTFRPSDADSKNSRNHHKQPEELPIAIDIDERRRQKQQKQERQRNRQDQPERRSQVFVRNAVALAAVASLILAAVGIFNRYNFVKHPATGATLPDTTVIAGVGGWSSVIIGLAAVSRNSTNQGEMLIENYNPVNGNHVQLPANHIPANAQLDSVSHDGLNLLYHYMLADGKTYYAILSQGVVDKRLFSSQGTGGNGTWSTDGSHVYVSTSNGIVEVSVVTGTARNVVSSLRTPQLKFYRDGYLYYENTGDLYRVNIGNGVQQSVTQNGKNAALADFLLSPDGSTIYYVNRAPAGGFGIHAVNRDGTNPQSLRQDASVLLIGFAADNALMYLQRSASGTYQVVKLGKTAQQDQTVMDDVAPGAVSVDEQNTALAPFAHGLVVPATDQSGKREIWFDNLDTRKQQVLLTPDNDTQIPGWDRLVVPETTVSPTPGITATQTAFDGWNAAALAEPADPVNGLWSIANYDYLTGQSLALVPGDLHSPLFGGISPDGKNLLYQFSSGGHTLYYTLQQLPRTGFFYELNESNAINAIWMSPSSRSVLIATVNSGVMQVDTQTGQSQALLPNLKTAGIRFYRDGYLYFVGAEDRATGALYRINVSNGVVQQVTFRSLGATYWLSPDGGTVYFANKVGPAGNPGLYAVNSDGTNSRLLRSYADGTPIGYAANDDLEIMREVHGKFEVVELGVTPQQDRIVFADAAPGAVSLCNSPAAAPGTDLICDHNIALAPLGHALIVQATYADGSIKLWSDNVTTGSALLLQIPAQGNPVQLIGWDKLAA